MNTPDLASIIVKKTGYALDVAEEVVEIILGAMREELLRGKPVKIQRFGTLSVRRRDERKIRCTKTGKDILIPSQRYVYWSPSVFLKKDLNL